MTKIFTASILTSTVLLWPTVAQAGKLAEGLFGLKWGGMAEFPAPTKGCVHNPEPGIEWVCPKKIGQVNARASFAWKFETFYGGLITTQGFQACTDLHHTLVAAWGPPVEPPQLSAQNWKDGDVVAGWEYNEYTHKCHVAIAHLDMITKVEDLEKKSAAMGADDL